MVNEMSNLKLWDDPGPDRGYAWIIFVFTFLINLLTVGYGKCQGNLFIEIQKSVGVDREQAAWPGTIYMLSFSFSALFAGIANHYFGWRQILSFLVTLGLIGFICGYLGPSTIPWICVYQGIIGISIGPIYPVLLQITSFYFVKHRSKAQNTTIAGFSLGSLIYPVLLEHSIELFGFRGSWLITGGIFMQTLVFALLMRPLTRDQFPVLGQEKSSSLLLKATLQEEFVEDKYEDIKFINENEIDYPSKRNGSSTDSFNNKLNENGNGTKTILTDDLRQFGIEDVNTLIVSHSKAKEIQIQTCSTLEKPKKDSGYLKDMIILLTDPLYILFIFTITIEVTLYVSASFLIIDHGIDTGLTVLKSTMLIITISIGDGLARLLVGWLIDKKFLGLMKFYALGCFLQALVYVAIGFAPNTNILFFACFMNGVIFCLTSGLRTLITTNTYGVERAVTITGMMLGMQGFFLIFSPFIIGFLRDGFGSYVYLFLLYSVLNILVVISIIVLEFYYLRRNKKDLIT